MIIETFAGTRQSWQACGAGTAETTDERTDKLREVAARLSLYDNTADIIERIK